MTVLRDAFLRAGVPVLARPAGIVRRAPATFIDPSILSDKQLIDDLSSIRVTVADISRQLDDDKEDEIKRGDRWRGDAKKARRYQLLRIDQLTEEARRRGLVAAIPALAEKVALQAIEAAQREASAREREERASIARDAIRKQQEAKEARIRSSNERNKTQCEMFVQAAKALHSQATCLRIWDKAREMFPDAKAWGDS